jgi:hypothetical protein
MEKWKKRDYLLIQNKKRSTASNIRVNLWTELFSSEIHLKEEKEIVKQAKHTSVPHYRI